MDIMPKRVSFSKILNLKYTNCKKGNVKTKKCVMLQHIMKKIMHNTIFVLQFVHLARK